jgi:hypothetical protein
MIGGTNVREVYPYLVRLSGFKVYFKARAVSMTLENTVTAFSELTVFANAHFCSASYSCARLIDTTISPSNAGGLLWVMAI